MKKKFLLLPLSLLFLASCNSSPINIPKSPFNDTYQRIGMKSEYNHSLSSINSTEFTSIKSNLEKDSTKVSSYSYNEEFRDLEYAYFGKESSSVSRCRLTSKYDVEQRYANRVKIGSVTNNEQIQTANAGIYKTNTTTEDYKFDVKYKEKTGYGTYENVTKITNDEGTKIIPESPDPKTYSSTEVETLFGLKPIENHIKAHFTDTGMNLFGENCVYGKFNGNNYLIKEGNSKFGIKMTNSGRKYVTSYNYFYEGILNSSYQLTDFRFYSEQLILSEAWDGDTIPILYLEKPVLISFTETKYKINYADSFPIYDGGMPGRNY